MIDEHRGGERSTSGSSEKGQTRAGATKTSSSEISAEQAARQSAPAIIARGQASPRSPGADRVADPHARRRAEAHGEREGDIVDREHRLEGAGGGIAELGGEHHQAGEAGQLQQAPIAGTSPNQASARHAFSARRSAAR